MTEYIRNIILPSDKLILVSNKLSDLLISQKVNIYMH